MSWLFVPASVVSKAASNSPCLTPEPFVMSRGKPMRWPSLQRAWKTKAWMKRLSGLTLPPSTASRGVARWIASLPVSRVSPSPSPASASHKTTPDGSGPTLQEYLAKYDPASSSWKTCQGSFLPDLETFSGTWPRSGSMRDGVVFERPTLAPVKGANGGSAWPTPTVKSEAQTAENPTPGQTGGTTLPGEAMRWPTPRVTTSGMAPSQKEIAEGNPKKRLEVSAQLWTTPCADDTGNRTKQYAQGGTALSMQAGQWPTPHASAGTGAGNAGRAGGVNIQTAVATWPTPTTRDHKDGATTLENTPVNGLLGRQVLVTPMDGKPTSKNTRTLNPRFVEALMGWPIGWTDCERAVTASSPSKPRSRGELSQFGYG